MRVRIFQYICYREMEQEFTFMQIHRLTQGERSNFNTISEGDPTRGITQAF